MPNGTSNHILLITHYDERYRFLNSTERLSDQQLIHSFRESGPIIILYLNTAPPFILQYPEYTWLIPSLSSSEKISRFNSIAGNQHPVSANETASCPIFIIDFCARYLANNPNFNFQGFNDLVNHQGQHLYNEMLSCTSPENIERFFRSFLTMGPGGTITGSPKRLSSISHKSGINPETSALLLEKAMAYAVITKHDDEHFALASDTLLSYWQTLSNWAAIEAEAITQYLFFRKLALLYQERKGDLLSATQLSEAERWRNNLHFSHEWAEQYAGETELIINYIRFSEQHNIADQEARERRRKRLLKLTRSIAVFIGIAFIVSSTAAVFAAVERNNALQSKTLADQEKINAVQARDQANAAAQQAQRAQQAESSAKKIADQERLKALEARDEAEKEKNAALLARVEADKEKNAALLAKAEEEKAKILAEQQRLRAENAGAAEAAARQQATLNFNNAEKLRRQQVARNDALNALQRYYEGNYQSGLQKAADAYRSFTQNDGHPYDADILKALITGDAALHQRNINTPHELKNIQLSPSGNTLVYQTIHGKLATPTSLSLPIPLPDIQSYCLINDHLLAAGASNGQLCLFAIPSQSTIAITPPNPAKPILHLSYQHSLLAFSPGSIRHLDLQLNTIQITNTPQIAPLSRFSAQQDSLLSFAFLKNTLHFIPILPTSPTIPPMSIPNPISASSNILHHLLFIGDQQGFVHLAELQSGNILHSTKIHQSAISYCQIIYILQTPLLITAGFDHVIQIFPLDGPHLQLLNPIDLKGHRSWIRAAAWNPHRQVLLSAGNDKQISTWSLNPLLIIDNLK